ncbi:hypothetical protein TNCT_298481, partial [Trichonephila clavata]
MPKGKDHHCKDHLEQCHVSHFDLFRLGTESNSQLPA